MLDIKFATVPTIHLRTEDELRAALLSKPWEGQSYPFKYLVRSDFIVNTIHELAIENGGPWNTVYNAQAKKRVMEKLGYPKMTDAEYAAEGDEISLLVYNAQNWRRMDMFKAAGFVEGTQELLQEALAMKMKIETTNGNILTPRDFGGKIYAMKPRSKTRYVEIEGQPIRLLTAKQSKAIEDAEKKKFEPKDQGGGIMAVEIAIGLGHPANLEVLGV